MAQTTPLTPLPPTPTNQTAAPTRRPSPPTSVVLGDRSFDRLSILAVSAVIGVGLVAVLVVVAYWCCCRRRTQGACASVSDMS